MNPLYLEYLMAQKHADLQREIEHRRLVREAERGRALRRRGLRALSSLAGGLLIRWGNRLKAGQASGYDEKTWAWE